jgi:murein DD-endopeptidase MepM/ murein hydrolase activator NlpD
MELDMAMTDLVIELYIYQDEIEQQLAFEAAIPTLWPMAGSFNINGFGYRRDPIEGDIRFHNGIDIINSAGTEIYAAGGGMVTFTGNLGGWGLTVIINHGYGYATLYSHCSSIAVTEGQIVARGEVVAACGSTGRTVGSHLHFELHSEGSPIDPYTAFER